MAKKKEEKITVDVTGMRMGPAIRCKLPHCMGSPKEFHIPETFEGYICKECFVVYAYKPQITAEQQEKLDGKTITTDEAQLKKLEEAANKRVQKKVKTKGGEQTNLF